MIRFYFHPTPNPAKVALFLEETGLPYEVVPVDTSKGEQHTASLPRDQPERQGAGDRRYGRTGRQGSARLRFHRDPALPRREDRQVPRHAGGPAGAALLAAVHRLRPRAILRPGRAFPVRRARGPRLCREPLPARSRAALSGAERPSRRPRLHRRRQLHDRRHVGLGLARPRLARAEGRGRSARRLSQPQASVRDRRCPPGGRRAHARSARTIAFKKVNDEETKRALFPSNYPPAA